MDGTELSHGSPTDADQLPVPGHVGVVGLGLIGGSFAKAMKRAGRKVYVDNRSRSAVELALIETAAGELDKDTIPDCELIILCSFPEACIAWLEEHAPLISPGTVVVDACGSKTLICETCFALAANYEWNFVGGHPMAGSENSGFAYSREDMFDGASMVLCAPPLEDIARADLLERTKKLLEPCGFGIYRLTTPQEHDRVIAYTSQLPHIIANAYIKSPTNAERKGFSGGAWRDLTRISKCNVNMWTLLYMQNYKNLVPEIDGLIEELVVYRNAIASLDEDTIRQLLEEGNIIKQESDAQ